MRIEERVPLAPFTTFHIGGEASFFTRVGSVDELKEALAYAQEKSLSFFILGGGSNILISDEGFIGLVIKIEIMGVEVQKDTNTEDTFLVCGAGESWDGVVAYATQENLWGIENLSGIPGTVGAAPVQNIGAYGCELKDIFLWVEVYDTHTGEIKRFIAADCLFGYRTSIFKRVPGRYVIVRLALRLSTTPNPQLHYKDLTEVFQYTNSTSLTLTAIRSSVLAIRARKFPDIRKEGTAGSFFLNPSISPAHAKELHEKYPALPQFEVEGGIKISLAWLLDHALGLKGFSVGGARLFEKQPLVIAAARGASSHDIRALAQTVIQKIQEHFSIRIEPEVRIIE